MKCSFLLDGNVSRDARQICLQLPGATLPRATKRTNSLGQKQRVKRWKINAGGWRMCRKPNFVSWNTKLSAHTKS